MRKGVGSGVGSGAGSGSIGQRYGSGDPDPPQNVTDPPHWCAICIGSAALIYLAVRIPIQHVS
jgi:hypothetical protein